MCECGCGELNPIAKIAAGDGKWLMLEVYPGCRDCGTSWQLTIQEFAEDDEWDADLVERTPTAELSETYRQWGVPILDTQILRKHFAQERGDDDEFSETNFALEEFISRGGLIDVFHETRRADKLGTSDSAVQNQEEIR